MSRYSDTIPTSHQRAFPPHHQTSWYGPPPPVPASLTSNDTGSFPAATSDGYGHVYQAGPSGNGSGNRGRDYLKSLGSSMAGMRLGDGDGRDAGDERLLNGRWEDERVDRWSSAGSPPLNQAYRPPDPRDQYYSHTPQAPYQPYTNQTHRPANLTPDKPLPSLPPPPPLPARPHSDPPTQLPSGNLILGTSIPVHPSVSATATATATATVTPTPTTPPKPRPPLYPSRTPPKSFKASPYLIIPGQPHRPASDPVLPTLSTPTKATGIHLFKHSNVHPEVIDLTLDSPSSDGSSIGSPAYFTPRSPARIRRRAISDQPPRRPVLADASTSTNTSTRRMDGSTPPERQECYTPPRRAKGAAGVTETMSPSPIPAYTPTSATQCAGYTRTGERCKRLVKVGAPFLATLELGDGGVQGKGAGNGGTGEEDKNGGRYCKDHAGMICQVEGFYSRDKPGLWVAFDDWIPPELGQQTKTLIRTTMESRLTDKESPGFIYAYELRDLQTLSTSFYKVGRTDNVPRRIGEWTNQCQSRTPTLRDIFPLSTSRQSLLFPTTSSSSSIPSSHLNRTPTPNRSFLPGAISSGTLPSSRPNPGVKRWERLVHLELSDIAQRSRADEWGSVRGKCGDCGKVHREVFAVPREGEGWGGEGSYQVVLEVVSRWERFVRIVCD